tara:strand:+ start:323 stop:556 length:234 start_codon:yes stop_codon:yes gene_type:complete
MYEIGDMVEVRDYYADMIPRGVFTALIVGIRKYVISASQEESIIYDLLDLDTSELKAAEKFAVLGIVEEKEHERICS